MTMGLQALDYPCHYTTLYIYILYNIIQYSAIIWEQGMSSLQKTIVISTKSDHCNKKGVDNNLHIYITSPLSFALTEKKHLLYVA